MRNTRCGNCDVYSPGGVCPACGIPKSGFCSEAYDPESFRLPKPRWERRWPVPVLVAWLIYFVLFGGLIAWCGQARAADDTLWLSGGQSVTNSSYPLLKSKAWGVAQDLSWRDWHYRLGYVNEGHKEDEFTLGKRDGIYAQWLGTHWLTPRLGTELSIGPYISATTVSAPGSRIYRDEYRLNAIGGAGVKYRLSDHVSVMASWQRALWTKIEGRYADTDIFGIWLGYRP